MTDETREPGEIDPDAPIDPEAIADDARKTFSLADRLTGMKQRTAKVPIFTDVEAVDEYHRLNDQAQRVNDLAGKVDLKKAGGPEQHAALLEQYNALEPQVEAAKEAMLKSALSIQLRAYPNIVVKVARRDARRKFRDEALGGVPPERELEVREYIDLRLLGESIVKVVDAEGNELNLGPRDELGQILSDQLPPSQWQRLYDTFVTMTLTDQIGQAATDDPGF